MVVAVVMADLFKSNCWERGEIKTIENPVVPTYCRGAGRGVGRGRKGDQAAKVGDNKAENLCLGNGLGAICSEKTTLPASISAADYPGCPPYHTLFSHVEFGGQPTVSGTSLSWSCLDDAAEVPKSCCSSQSSTTFQSAQRSTGAVYYPLPPSVKEADCASGDGALIPSFSWNNYGSPCVPSSFDENVQAVSSAASSGYVGSVISKFVDPPAVTVDRSVSSSSLSLNPNAVLPCSSPVLPTVPSPLASADLPELDMEKHSESNFNLSLEPTMANILAHTFSLLSLRPGTFSGVMPALTQILRINIRVESDLDEVVNSICFACIKDENFRYNGARICTHFVKDFESLHFLDKLLERCQTEYDLGFASSWFCEGQSSYGKVALFVGELMVQLKAELGQPTEVLIRFVLHFLDYFLVSGQDVMLKFLVLLLKLTGMRLRACVKDRFDDIMIRIKRAILLESTSSRSRELLLSLVLKLSHDLSSGEVITNSDVETVNNGATGFVPLELDENCYASCLETLSAMRIEDGDQNTPFLPTEDHLPDCSLSNDELNKLLELLSEEERKMLEMADDYEEFLSETRAK